MIDAKELSTPVMETDSVGDLPQALERAAEKGVRGKIGIVMED